MPSDSVLQQAQPVADLPLAELASGVDALYLSGRVTLPETLLAKLEDRRQLAEGTSASIPFEFGGHEFSIAPHGWGKYRYCLDDLLHGRIGFTASRTLPAIRVQPKSSFMHTIGPAGAVTWFRSLLDTSCTEVPLSVSRIDLYADFEGWRLGFDDHDRFVCRADAVRTFEYGSRLTGIQFGNRKTKTVLARIYDKTQDVARTGADWWFDVWGRTSSSTGPVHRVEFEINREGLSQFGLLTPAETLAATGDVWTYATTDWLTHRCPTGDANRSRWPISAEWRSVQLAELVQRQIGAHRITTQLRCGSLRRLSPGLVGYVVSFAALSDTSGIDDTMTALGRHLSQDEMVRGTAFADRVRRRRIEGTLP